MSIRATCDNPLMGAKRSGAHRGGLETERVAPGYSQMLRKAIVAAGLTQKQLRDAGTSKQVIWRVLGQREAPSFAAAERVRRKIRELRPALDLPPPAAPVESESHYEWIRIGSALLNEDPEQFQALLRRVREAYNAMSKERQALAEIDRMTRDPRDDD